MSAVPPSAVYTAARVFAHDTITSALVAPAAQSVTALYDNVVAHLEQTLQHSPDHGQHACHQGCAWCCHQPVYITRLEAIAIVTHLRQHWPASWLAQLPTLLQQRIAKRTALGGDRAVIQHGMACAFLSEDNSCTIHAARPLACRGHLSTSSQACADHYVDITNAAPPIDAFAHDAAKGLLHGIRAANDNQPLQELHAAILMLIDSAQNA